MNASKQTKRKRPKPFLSVDVSATKSRSQRSRHGYSQSDVHVAATQGVGVASEAGSQTANATTANDRKKQPPILDVNAPLAWWKQGLVPMQGSHLGSRESSSGAPVLGLGSNVRGLLSSNTTSAASATSASARSLGSSHSGLAAAGSNGALGLPLTRGHLGALPQLPPSFSQWGQGLGADTPRSRLHAVFGRPAAVASTGTGSDAGSSAPPAVQPPPPAYATSTLAVTAERPATASPRSTSVDKVASNSVHPDTPGSVSSTTPFPPLSHRVGGAGGVNGGALTLGATFGIGSSPRDAVWHPNLRSQIVRNNPYGKSTPPLFQYAACSRPGGARGGDVELNEDRYTAVADALQVGVLVTQWQGANAATVQVASCADTAPARAPAAQLRLISGQVMEQQSYGQSTSDASGTVPSADLTTQVTVNAASAGVAAASTPNTIPCSSLYGVMDGHGGGAAATAASDVLFELLASAWVARRQAAAGVGSWRDITRDAFCDAFASLQARLQARVDANGVQEPKKQSTGPGGVGESSLGAPPAPLGHSQAGAGAGAVGRNLNSNCQSVDDVDDGPISGLDGTTVCAALVQELTSGSPQHKLGTTSTTAAAHVPSVGRTSADEHTGAHQHAAPLRPHAHRRFGVSVAHVGDSAALLVCSDGSFALLTPPHAPWRGDEQRRLAAENCAIKDGRVAGVLDMTRSCGDCDLGAGVSCCPEVLHFEFKLPAGGADGRSGAHAHGERASQSLASSAADAGAEPEATDRKATRQSPVHAHPMFLVLASDGVWERVPPLHVARVMLGVSPSPPPPSDSGTGLEPPRSSGDSNCACAFVPSSVQDAFRSAPDAHWAAQASGRVKLDTGDGPTNAAGAAQSAPDQGGMQGVALHARVLAERCVAEALCRGARDDVTALVVDLREVR